MAEMLRRRGVARPDCTYHITGSAIYHNYVQQWYQCFTCQHLWPEVESGLTQAICQACIGICHAGHEVRKSHEAPTAGGFCDCGEYGCVLNRITDPNIFHYDPIKACEEGNLELLKQWFTGQEIATLESKSVAPGQNGRTLLQIASRAGHVPIVEWLLMHNISVNDVDETGSTALHLAAYYGKYEVCKLLVDAAANPDVVNKMGERPIDNAQQKKYWNIVQLLGPLSKQAVQSNPVIVEVGNVLRRRQVENELSNWIAYEMAPQSPGFVNQIKVVDSILKNDEGKLVEWLQECKKTHEQLTVGAIKTKTEDTLNVNEISTVLVSNLIENTKGRSLQEEIAFNKGKYKQAALMENLTADFKKALTKAWETEHGVSISSETLEYLLAIRFYTSDHIYQVINKSLWSSKSSFDEERKQAEEVLKDWEVMVFQIFKGIVNIPGPFIGSLGYVTLFRKFKDSSFLNATDYVVGNVVVWMGFSSTAMNEFSYHGKALCEIVVKQKNLGAVIWKYSIYQNENEVLLPPFTSFKVLEVSTNVTRASSQYEKYIKLECVGISTKVSNLVVPEKEKKVLNLQKTLSAVDKLKNLNQTLSTSLAEPLKKIAGMMEQQKKELDSLFGLKDYIIEDNTTPSTKQTEKTNCPYGICCYDLNETHRKHYLHPTEIYLPNSPLHLTRDLNKDKLLNPLSRIPTQSRWMYSPNVAVMVEGKIGKLRGWEMNGKVQKTGKLLVTLSHDFSTRSYSPDEIEPLEAPDQLCTPWYSFKVAIYRADYVRAAFDSILRKKINGMDKTFFDVFKGINEENIPIFIIGGAVRDIVAGKPIDQVKDIDTSFGCSAGELEMIAKKRGWIVSCRNSGLLTIGKEGALAFEGKSIGCHSFDIYSWRADNQLGSIGTDLSYETIYRDFTMNTLCYDPFNQVVVDPTGYGVSDAINRKVRIPMQDTTFKSLWIKGNPTKILRYWKFVAKGYQAVDEATRAFFISTAVDEKVVTAANWKSARNALLYGSGEAAMMEWRNAVEKDLGQSFVMKVLS